MQLQTTNHKLQTPFAPSRKRLLIVPCVALLCFLLFTHQLHAQINRIVADTTKLAKVNGGAGNELFLQNSTKNIEGYLFNSGEGRTKFKPAVDTIVSLNDSTLRVYRSSLYFDIAVNGSGTGGGGANLANSDLTQTDAVRNYNIKSQNLIFDSAKVFEVYDNYEHPLLSLSSTSEGGVSAIFQQSYDLTKSAHLEANDFGNVILTANETGVFSTVVNVDRYGVSIESDKGGLLIPLKTQTERNAIATPATGLLIYQTDNTPGFYYYNGSGWTDLGGADSVTSVFGRSGIVVAATNDYTWAQINKATSSLADITTRLFSDLQSKPTTVGGYGITDFNSLGDARWSLLSHNHTLDGLSNVTITSKATGDLLKWNGSAWINFVPTYISSFTELDPIYSASSWFSTTNNSTNWNTAFGWGNHASAGYLTANQAITVTATGDATGTSSSSATAPSIGLTLATVNSNVGSFGAAAKSLSATVNAKGLVTAISEQNILIAESQVTSLVSDLAAKQTGYTNLSSIGALADAAGWLKNNGSGTFSYSTPTKTDVGLSAVENTALSTWGGSTNINTAGTFTTGVWNATAIGNTYLANSTISGIALGSNLAALTATNSTITFSGSYNGSTARTVGLNLGNANTWTAKQIFQLATNPLEIGYDASNYLRITPASNGSTAFALTGTTPYFNFTNNVGINQATPTARLDVTTDDIRVTQTDASGITLANTTASTVGITQQYSPALRFRGTAWKSTATAVSQTSDFRIYNATNTGTSTITSNLNIDVSINGAAYSLLVEIRNNQQAVFWQGINSVLGAILQGGIQTNTTAINSNFNTTSTSQGIGIGSTSNADIIFAGATNVNYRSFFHGTTSTTLGVGNSLGSVVFASNPATEAASGNHPYLANTVINPLGTITAGAATVGSTVSLYVTGVNSGTTITGKNYAFISDGLVKLNGALEIKRTTVADAGYTLLATDYFVTYTTLTATRAVTLPAASTVTNQEFIIKDEVGNAGTNVITVVGTINGATNPTIINANYGTYTFYSNGTAYFTK